MVLNFIYNKQKEIVKHLKRLEASDPNKKGLVIVFVISLFLFLLMFEFSISGKNFVFADISVAIFLCILSYYYKWFMRNLYESLISVRKYVIVLFIVIAIMFSIGYLCENLILQAVITLVILLAQALLANTKVAELVNTSFEIILGFYFLYADAIYNKIIDITHLNRASMIENVLLNIKSEIDTVVRILITANAFIIIAIKLHSYWIEKYNNGEQIGNFAK